MEKKTLKQDDDIKIINNKILGEKIRNYRKRKKLSLEDLAKQMGISKLSIQKYEVGKRTIPFNILVDFFKKWVYNNKAIEKILEEWEQIPLFNYEKEKKLAKIEEKVESLIKQNIENLGYELYDVEYVKEGKDYYLRVYIDKDTGISLEDCELVSNNINEILDQADYIKDQYFLEVSSPGVERVLKKDKHLQCNIGAKVQVKLFKSFNGQKQYEGILKDYSETIISLETQNGIFEIERQNIGQIKTMFDWN